MLSPEFVIYCARCQSKNLTFGPIAEPRRVQQRIGTWGGSTSRTTTTDRRVPYRCNVCGNTDKEGMAIPDDWTPPVA